MCALSDDFRILHKRRVYYLSKSESPLSVVVLEDSAFNCLSADVVEPTDAPICSSAFARNSGHFAPNSFSLGLRVCQSQ